MVSYKNKTRRKDKMSYVDYVKQKNSTLQDALLNEIPANSYVEIVDSGYRV